MYILIGYLKPEDTPERLAIIERINTDDDSGTAIAVPVPAGEVEDVVGRTPIKD